VDLTVEIAQNMKEYYRNKVSCRREFILKNLQHFQNRTEIVVTLLVETLLNVMYVRRTVLVQNALQFKNNNVSIQY